jgi:hypothetical protein
LVKLQIQAPSVVVSEDLGSAPISS